MMITLMILLVRVSKDRSRSRFHCRILLSICLEKMAIHQSTGTLSLLCSLRSI